MTALCIVLGILAFFILIAWIRLTVVIRAEDEFSLILKIGFLPIRLAPKKEKKLNPKKFRIKKFRRMRRKEEKKYLAQQQKKQKGEIKKAEAEEKKAAEAEKKGVEEAPKRSLKENIAFGIDLVKYVVARAVAKFGRYLKIEISRIDITVAGDDPAKTAVTFGYVCQAVAYIKELLDQNLNVKYPGKREEYIAVRVDYLSEKPVFKVHIAFGIRIWQILAVGITALKGYLFDVRKPENKPKDESGKTEEKETDASSDNKENNKMEKKDKPAKAGTEV